MARRIAEVREVVAELDGPLYASALRVAEADPRSGYAVWSESYDEGNALLAVEQPVVEHLLADVPPGRALDAACGTGRHAKHLASRHDVTGVDASPEMLEIARASVPEAVFVEGSLTDLQLPDATFDVVVCALALCHVRDLAAAVGELARVARPGARIVLTDPHPAGAMFANQGMFPTPDGGMGFVRNYFHAHGTYIDAITSAGLGVRSCVEPLFAEEHLPELLLQFAPGAAKQALIGMPFALIWDLEKPR